MLVANLGFPRIGPHRELKKAVEQYWRGDLADAHLHEVAAMLRRRLDASEGMRLRCRAGQRFLALRPGARHDRPAGSGSARFNWSSESVDLPTYFRDGAGDSDGVPAMEMTKWFDTNYHYLVPELHSGPDLQAGVHDRSSTNSTRRSGWSAGRARTDRSDHVSAAWQNADGTARPLDLLNADSAGLRRSSDSAGRGRQEWVQIDEPAW